MTLTIENLKANRTEIIETITEKVGAEKVKEVMVKMAETIGWSGIRSTNAVEFASEVIALFDIKPFEAKRQGILLDGERYCDMSDYNRANNMKLYKSR
jgi:hypothetical protein